MKLFINKNLLRATVVLVTALLVVNIVATFLNNRIIEDNKQLQKQAEDVKVTVSRFGIIIIHNLDLGLRGYALYKKDKYLYPMKFAVNDKDSLMDIVEEALRMQQYPMTEFHQLRDSIDAFVAFSFAMLELVKSNNLTEFYRLSDMDKGYHLWLQYENFASEVYQYEDTINLQAQQKYDAAIRRDYLIQIVLLLLCAPTLFFTSTHTNKKFEFEIRLRKLEEEKAIILESQNRVLEQTVGERTHEIQEKNRELQMKNEEITAQNEEITAQNEEITSQNELLYKQREDIFRQNRLLAESKKQQLEMYTTSLMEKSEIIAGITAELDNLKRQYTSYDESVVKFSEMLQFSILTDEDWERFKKKFQEVYPTFFATMRYKFPAITASELRLSALIKMNLSLKEAGSMLGISSSSVKKSRYRLKKRLGLADEESLEDFVQNSVSS